MTLKLEDTGDCKQSCDSRLKLEVGKTYVDSKGGISNISRKLNGFYLDERGDFFRKNGEWVSSIYPDGDIDYNLIAEYKAETRCPTCNALVKERAPVVHEAWVVWYKAEFSGGTFCSLTRIEPNKAQTMNGGEILHIEKITYEEK
jgi:hypothetical protein